MDFSWTELRRRKVVRVAVAYIIAAWVLMQVGDTVLGLLELPGWIGKALVVVLALGLPLALVLAWMFDITPQGLEKAEAADEAPGKFRYTDPEPIDVGELDLLRPQATPLIGREAEMGQLSALLENAAAGHGGLVMIGGEPGAGKTRLGEEALALGHSRGMLPLAGHAYEEHGAPFVTSTEILEQLVRAVPPENLPNVLGPTASEIALLLPELRRRLPNIPPAQELPPEQQQRYLFSALLEMTERLAGAVPLVVLLDDMQWADESTMLLLEYLAPHLSRLRVIYIATYRDVQADMGEPFQRALARLTRLENVSRIALRDLGRDEVAILLASLGQPDPPDPVVEVIHRETEGNPFFVQSVYRHLAEEGLLFDAEGEWRTDLDPESLAVPEGVRLVIDQRLKRLGDETQAILKQAAVMGLRFELGLVEQACGEDGETVLSAIESAENAGLAFPASGPRSDRYEFSHALVRQTLLEALSAPRRQRLHLALARAMKATRGDNARYTANIARHLYDAGPLADAKETVDYLRRAAEYASSKASFAEAVMHLDRALELADETATDRSLLLYERAVARLATGDWSGAAEDWREALPGLEAAGEADRVTETCWNLATFANWGNQFETGEAYVKRGLASAGEAASAGRCRLLAVLGHLHCAAGDFKASDSALREAESMAIELDEPRVRWGEVAQAELHQCEHHLLAAEFSRRSGRAIEGAQSLGDPWILAGVLGISVIGACWNGEIDQLETINEQLQPAAERSGNAVGGAYYLYGVGFLAYAHGDLVTFTSRMRECSDSLRSLGTAYWTVCHVLFGHGLFLQGRSSEARKAFEECRASPLVGVYQNLNMSFWLPFLAATDPDESAALLEESVDRLPKPGAVNPYGRWCLLAGFIEASAILGRNDHADLCLELAQELLNTGASLIKTMHLIQKILALAAMNAGDFARAEESFELALRQAEELPVVPERAEVRRWYAVMLERRSGPGDRERGRKLLDEATAIRNEIGMPETHETVRPESGDSLLNWFSIRLARLQRSESAPNRGTVYLIGFRSGLRGFKDRPDSASSISMKISLPNGLPVRVCILPFSIMSLD